ncbi:MAG: hypothetical protein ABGY96_15905 [bacterium]|nr:hypothetical protein [Gammaproteobacteria bacterium]
MVAYISGGAQHSFRDGNDAPHPADSMAIAAIAALKDAGVEDFNEVDLLACVEPLSWSYEQLGKEVATRLQLSGNVQHLWVPAGGTSPQDILHKVVQRITDGEINCAVICGAESMKTRRRALKQSREPDWPQTSTKVDPMRGQAPFSSELERRHGLNAPLQLFPLIENAIRAANNRTTEEQSEIAATLLAANARVAADNPHAWFRDSPSMDSLLEVSENNRMIVHPYTKRMNAIMDVDQCAAIVVTREVRQHSAAILGGAGAEEIWNPLERESLSSCPGMSKAISVALQRAGLASKDITAMDLYSCFPSAIELALQALGSDADDKRQLSLTGGLAFAGGPGNAYVLHSLSAALTRLRHDPGQRLLVTGIGMANTKHSATVLTGFAHIPGAATGTTSYRESQDQRARRVMPCADGNATLCAYTVEYHRDGSPSNLIVIADMDSGERTIANIRNPKADVENFLVAEPTGRRGKVEYDAAENRNFFTMKT